jgi:hypothetical protein
MTWLRRGSVISFASVLLLTVGDSAVYTQNPVQPISPLPPTGLPTPPGLPPQSLGGQYSPPGIEKLAPLEITSPAMPGEPVAPTVDILMVQLESVRKQKAEIEAKETAILQQLQSLLKAQKARLKKLGVVEVADPPEPKGETAPKRETIPPQVITPGKSRPIE